MNRFAPQLTLAAILAVATALTVLVAWVIGSAVDRAIKFRGPWETR